MRRLAVILLLILPLGACQAVPPLVQLATACDSAASVYFTASAYRAQGRLSQPAIDTLTGLEPTLLALCDKTNPPTDKASAAARVQEIADRMAVAAGVPR